MSLEMPFRVFAVNSAGNARALSENDYLSMMGVSPAANAAYDIMTDDGVPPERAWSMALAMDKVASPRGDAEAQARHFVKLRKSLRP